VREAIAEVPDTTPLRRILLAIVDSIVSTSSVDIHALVPRLMAYGQSLEYDARWALASDIYETVVAHADPVADADLVVPAFLQLGHCRRMLDEFDLAAVAYESAARVAHAAGDMFGLLRSRIGDAKIAISRGNMPLAERILDETTERAQLSGFDDLQSRSLHERAYLAGLSGQHERAVHFAYQALSVTPAPRDRDRILVNIAAGLQHLGLYDAARDANLVLAVTSQEQYVRWMAELNLMELAALDGIELQFDKYRRDLESADFSPMFRVTYLLHVGRGYHTLGDAETGIPYLERAVDVAAQHKLNPLLFECEEALSSARRRATRHRQPQPEVLGKDLRFVVDAVQEMREVAGIA